MEEQKQSRSAKPNARKMYPSRTLRVLNVPENSTKLLDLIGKRKFKANYIANEADSSAGTYYIQLDEPVDVLRDTLRTLRNNEFRAYYQNYYLYFKLTNAEAITYETIPTLRANLKSKLSPAQVLDFVLYRKLGPDGQLSWKGDGHIVLDSRDDLLKLLSDGKQADVEGHSFTFYAYKFQKKQEAAAEAPTEAAAEPAPNSI